VLHHIQILMSTVGVNSCGLFWVSIDVIGRVYVSFDYLLDQLGMLPNQLATNDKAAAGMVGPHLS